MAQILVPFDYSANAINALKQALYVAKTNGSNIEVLHIINLMISSDSPMVWTDQQEKEIYDKLTKHIEEIKAEVHAEYIQVSIYIQKGERVSEEILLRAENTDAVLIVMGTHGVTGLVDRLLGTNSLDVISESNWPVLLIPPTWQATEIKELVVAAELEDLLEVTDSIKDLASFFKTPARAVQLSGIIDTIEIKKRVIEDIPFEYVSCELDKTLAKNLDIFSKSLTHTILLMYIRPRKFLQKYFGKSFTKETAKVLEIPLLCVRK